MVSGPTLQALDSSPDPQPRRQPPQGLHLHHLPAAQPPEGFRLHRHPPEVFYSAPVQPSILQLPGHLPLASGSVLCTCLISARLPLHQIIVSASFVAMLRCIVELSLLTSFPVFWFQCLMLVLSPVSQNPCLPACLLANQCFPANSASNTTLQFSIPPLPSAIPAIPSPLPISNKSNYSINLLKLCLLDCVLPWVHF